MNCQFPCPVSLLKGLDGLMCVDELFVAIGNSNTFNDITVHS